MLKPVLGRTILALTLISLVAISCAPSASAPGPTKPQALTVAITADVSTLDPGMDNAGLSQAVVRNMFDTLVERDRDYKWVGLAAESWKVVSPTRWEFTIRKGMQFWNGDEVTADDVAFSFNRVLDPANKSPLAAFISVITEVQAPDRYTAAVMTKSAFTPLLIVLNAIPIISKSAAQATGLAAFGKNPMGSGPFKLTEWVKDDHITMAANANYWHGKPKLDQLTFKPIAEGATRAAALQTGQVGLVMDLPEQFINDVKSKSELQVSVIAGGRTHQFIMDSTIKPFNDVRVRQAVAYAIDYDSIITKVLGGNATRNCQVVSPDTFGYDPNYKCRTYDPQKAKQLLADAGYPNGFDVAEGGASGARPHDKEVQEAVGAMLTNVGIRVKINLFESNRWVQGYVAKEWPMTYHTNAGNGDAEYVFGFGFYSKTDRKYWQDPQGTDPLIDQSRAEFDPAKREKILQQIMGYFADQAAWVVLFNQADIWAMNKSVNWTPRGDGRLDMVNASIR